MGNLNNPAGRLHELLVRGKRESESTVTFQAWAKLLGVTPEPSLVLGRLAGVYALPEQIDTAIRALPSVNHELLLRWKPQVHKAFTMLQLQGEWMHFIRPIDDVTIYSLEVADDALARISTDAVIEPEQLEELHKQVRELLDEVMSSNIDSDVRSFLLEHLRAIDSAILDYRTSGTRPMRKACEATFGDAAFQPDVVAKVQQSGLGKRFLGTLALLAQLTALVNGALQLGERVYKLLPGMVDTTPSDQPVHLDENSPDLRA